MNPLPRFLGMALFVVLAVLTALLAVPVWHATLPAPVTQTTPVASSDTSHGAAAGSRPAAQTAQLHAFSQRMLFAIAVTGLVLAAALLFSLAVRSPRGGNTNTPFPPRSDIGTLARLAESSVAQGAELSRERDVRRRAEEDVQLKQRLLAVSLEEKIRLGRDLHDGIIQSLYAVGLTLETVRTLIKSDPAAAEQRLEQTRAGLNATIREVRAYIAGLSPDSLRRGSFARSFQAVADELRADRDARFEIQIDDDAAAQLTPEQTTEALQIAREAVSNALRHGAASLVTVRMHKGEGEICLLVQDDGCGFDPERAADSGHGLGNMQARAQALGASLRVISRPGDGARVLATFRLAPADVV
jgi:signal transduction histidine kinase